MQLLELQGLAETKRLVTPLSLSLTIEQTHLLKAWTNTQRNVDQNWSYMSLINLSKYSSQSRHGLHCDEVFWVFSVIHSCQHCTQNRRGEGRYLYHHRDQPSLLDRLYSIYSYLVASNVSHVSEASDAVHSHHVIRINLSS